MKGDGTDGYRLYECRTLQVYVCAHTCYVCQPGNHKEEGYDKEIPINTERCLTKMTPAIFHDNKGDDRARKNADATGTQPVALHIVSHIFSQIAMCSFLGSTSADA